MCMICFLFGVECIKFFSQGLKKGLNVFGFNFGFSSFVVNTANDSLVSFVGLYTVRSMLLFVYQILFFLLLVLGV